MNSSLNHFFNKQNTIQLDQQSKDFLYRRIQHQLHKTSLIKRFVSTSKYLTLWVFFGLFIVSLFTKTLFYKPLQYVNNLIWWLSPVNAEYIWSIISWNWSYDILINNTIIDTKKTKNNIPQWGSLIVKEWSSVQVKTKNNAVADIVWPAKITLLQKDNNIIVDVSYSNHITIKQPDIVITQWENKPLIVQTSQNTIIATNKWLDISLDTEWSDQIIKNNNGEVLVSSLQDSSKTLSLKTNESAILDDEIKLFAKTIVWEKDKQEKTLLHNKTIETTYNKIIQQSETQQWDLNQTTTIWLLKENNNYDIEQNDTTLFIEEPEFVDTLALLDQWKNSKSNLWDNYDKKIQTTSITTQQQELLDEKNDIMLATNTINTNQQLIINSSWIEDNNSKGVLDSKKILNDESVYLLEKIYHSYYHNNYSDLIDLLPKLCLNLQIECKKIENNADMIYVIRSINNHIIVNYIISPDILLIKNKNK